MKVNKNETRPPKAQLTNDVTKLSRTDPESRAGPLFAHFSELNMRLNPLYAVFLGFDREIVGK